jgi:hypothetical protein
MAKRGTRRGADRLLKSAAEKAAHQYRVEVAKMFDSVQELVEAAAEDEVSAGKHPRATRRCLLSDAYQTRSVYEGRLRRNHIRNTSAGTDARPAGAVPRLLGRDESESIAP